MTRAGWGGGYTVDVDYLQEYFADWVPLRTRFALLASGWEAPPLRSACELGFGQGMTIAVAAATGDAEWVGTDFNPSQVANARDLAGPTCRLFDDSFAEFAARDDLPTFDFIVLHGIWSWVSPENRAVLVDFIRRRLAVGGVLYVSYNLAAGWASMGAVRRLMKDFYDKRADRSAGPEVRVRATLAFAEGLLATGSAHLGSQPLAADRIAKLKTHDWRYILHEYLNDDWHPMHFAEVAEELAGAKLGYACSAAFFDHVDVLTHGEEQIRILESIRDVADRETMRDFFSNRNFRRDLWVKGAMRISSDRQRREIGAFTVTLLTRRADVTLQIGMGENTATLQKAIYEPILDRLADGPCTIADLLAALEPRGIAFGQIVEAVRVLLAKFDVGFVQDAPVIEARRASTRVLNRRLLDRVRDGDEVKFLASPVLGCGLPVDHVHLLFILAREAGHESADAIAAHAWEALTARGRSLVADGRAITDPDAGRARMKVLVEGFLEARLPVLTALEAV
ncbi:methyltransferase domain-containing protein [Siculibacillus lacustris]|uniref:Methyltransferase domain-containing protein n=1 Tax=Siculibacillus lacustris TaxID=1549641 RepID=A0A4Q9VN95_9HYPH|nr:class I SAM-dependent methyltransferase [Siculibacillus lacustris]TBW36583.1 methyltransferase domain-containing protein [Siculibacillus lacustris]